MRILPLASTMGLRDCKRNEKNKLTSCCEQKKRDSILLSSCNIVFKSRVLTRIEATKYLLKLGLGDLSCEKFLSVLDKFMTSSGAYSMSLFEKFDLISNKLDKHNIEKKGVMAALLTELDPNIEKFNSALDDMLERNIDPRHIATIFETAKKEDSFLNEIDYSVIRKLLRCRDLGVENIRKLEHQNRKLSSSDVDSLFFELPKMTINMFDILGEKAFVYSFKDKMDNVIDYLVRLGQEFPDNNLKDRLMLLTNPTNTDNYLMLEEEIFALKQEYKKCEADELRPRIEKQIATLTRKKNDIIENSLHDPKDILEVALIVAALRKSPEDANDVLDASNPHTISQKKNYYEVLNQKVLTHFGFNILNDDLRQRFELRDCKYLPRIFIASSEFLRQFKKLIGLILRNPGLSNLEIFNTLPQNIKTKSIFTEYSIDYDKYAMTTDPLYSSIKGENCNLPNIRARKADMNDIAHVLFMGQDADCCSKVSGVFDYTMISNLKNKYVSAIEILDGNNCVGNTMCYFALVDNELSFILDNLAFQSKYRYNNKIFECVIDCAKKICAEVGKEGVPIYLSGVRNQINTESLEFENKPLKIIGSCGKDYPYLDFMGNTINIDNLDNQNLYAQLFKIN